MATGSGDRFGPYTLISPLGEGGMGEVWKARDTRLDRSVALKISKADFTQRFEAEARAVAALNHPHICTLYDVGPNYLVMELIEGQPIRGPLPIAEALKYAGQICDALDAAHRKGIVHRDLKPANILATKGGIKLLDFGLAKQQPPVTPDDRTMIQGLTREGHILGTLQYMSPEQLQGQHVDARSDIFAFGCVLYEMITGKRAFDGANPASVISSILTVQPAPVSVAQPDTPPNVQRAIGICLAKDPDERWQTARDLKRELLRTDDTVPAVVPARRASAWIWPMMVVLSLGSAAAWYFGRAPAHETVVRAAILPPENGVFTLEGKNGSAAVSPDGASLAFVAKVGGRTSLWVRSLHDLQSRELPGTEGGYYPFWSPDGQNIGFFSHGYLRRLQMAGGSPQTICAVEDARGGSWGAQGDIVFVNSRRSPVYRVSASGGEPVAVTDLQNGISSHRWPWFLPDGRHFLYLSSPSGGAHPQNEIRFATTDGKENHAVMAGLWNSSVVFAAGRLLYFKSGYLMAQPFDPASGRFAGDPVRVAESVGYSGWFGSASFSASDTTLVFEPGVDWAGAYLTWFDAGGKELGPLQAGEAYNSFRISPDGKKVAALSYSADGTPSYWIIDAERGGRTPVAAQVLDITPAWLDSSTLILSGEHQGSVALFKKSVYLSTPPQILLTATGAMSGRGYDRSPDGKSIAFGDVNPRTHTPNIWLAPASGEGKARLLIESASTDTRPRFSPNAKWLTFDSDDTGAWEVYATAVPGGGRRWRISSGGGSFSSWSPDGRTVFYMTADNAIGATPIEVRGDELVAGKSHKVFQPPIRLRINRVFDVAPDGRFLVAVTPKAPSSALTLVTNWTSALLKK